MWAIPWIVEPSKNSFTSCILPMKSFGCFGPTDKYQSNKQICVELIIRRAPFNNWFKVVIKITRTYLVLLNPLGEVSEKLYSFLCTKLLWTAHYVAIELTKITWGLLKQGIGKVIFFSILILVVLSIILSSTDVYVALPNLTTVDSRWSLRLYGHTWYCWTL